MEVLTFLFGSEPRVFVTSGALTAGTLVWAQLWMTKEERAERREERRRKRRGKHSR